MKKTIVALVLSVVLFAPSLTYAQTASTTEQIQASYQNTLVQLISLLMDQVRSLQAQLAAQSDDIKEIKTRTSVKATGTSEDNVVSVPSLTSSVEVTGATTTISVSPKADSAHLMLYRNGGKGQGSNSALIDGKWDIVDLDPGSYQYEVTGYDTDRDGKTIEVGKTSGSFVIR